MTTLTTPDVGGQDVDVETSPGVTSGRRVSPARVFAAALTLGTLTAVIEDHGTHHSLPVRAWTGHASRSDRFLLDHCHGSTIDLGCGPGRLAAELRTRGHEVLGVDASRSAVAEAGRRGVPVACGSLFDPVPAEGTWDTALLADGNIGIGGNPAALLARTRQVIRAGGRIVLDLAPAGTGLRTHQLHLRAGGLASTSFPWAELGPEALPETAAAVGLVVTRIARRRGRTVAVLACAPSDSQALAHEHSHAPEATP